MDKGIIHRLTMMNEDVLIISALFADNTNLPSKDDPCGEKLPAQCYTCEDVNAARK